MENIRCPPSSLQDFDFSALKIISVCFKISCMPLTLDSIYKPINDFFLSRYKSGSDNPVSFRFDKFGSTLSDEDFIDPDNPGDTGLATERFSDLVDRLPIEADDGLNVFFSTNLIDDTYYYQVLNVSLPLVKEDDPYKEQIISAFGKVTAAAKSNFEKSSLARRGIPSFFSASYAAPNNWYDRTNKEIWETKTFKAEDASPLPATDKPKFKLWRLKATDAVLQNILPVKEAETVKPIELYNRVMLMKTSAKNIKPVEHLDRPVFFKMAPANAATKVRDHRTDAPVSSGSPVRDHRLSSTRPITSDHVPASIPIKVTDHRDIQNAISKLDFRKRFVVSQFVKEEAPTQPAAANSITISFDYCKVDIRRPWLLNAFLDNENWFIPGLKKGQLSDSDVPGNLSVMTVGFIAIKNLTIEANWSDTDIANSKKATDFGPFEVNAGIINNKLSHEGIQIIGWLLQKMPPLPPNDAPQ